MFERVATYDVPGQVAEIIAATPDGKTLIYTDSAAAGGWVRHHYRPEASDQRWFADNAGRADSVAVTPDGVWALVAVHAVRS